MWANHVVYYPKGDTMINDEEVVSLTMKKLREIILSTETLDNANQQKGPEATHKLIADVVSKDYYMKRFPKEIREAHLDGAIHIHDLEYFGTRPFCRSWDLRPILMYGFHPATGFTDASAPKHAEVAILQATKLLAIATTFHAGGQGLLHGLVFLSPYFEGKTYAQIKQLIQMLVYELNQMLVSRGGQTVFSSINLTPGCPTILEKVHAVRAGKILDQTYSDFEREIRLGFKAFMEVSLEGDQFGKMFPFPKLELAIEKKFLADEYHELLLMAFQIAAKTGGIYFDNLLMESKHADTSMACTQCCAYQFASDESTDDIFSKRLNFENDEHFKLGGMQVVSINLPRIAYLADHDDKKFMARLYDAMDIALDVFKIKKQRIVKQAALGNLSFLTQKTPGGVSFLDLDELVYEMGIVGLNECVQYHTGSQLHEGDLTFAKKVLVAMMEQCKLMSQFNEMEIVLARTPAETTAMRFAVCDLMSAHKDKALGVVKGDVEKAVGESRNQPVYYSNGFAPDVSADISVLQRIRLESEMWQYINGGSITNVYVGEQDPDPTGLMELTIRVFESTNIGYLAYTKDYSQCSDCNTIASGIQEACKKCKGTEMLVFSRITGYVSLAGVMRDGKFERRWNEGKAQELKDRHREDIR